MNRARAIDFSLSMIGTGLAGLAAPALALEIQVTLAIPDHGAVVALDGSQGVNATGTFTQWAGPVPAVDPNQLTVVSAYGVPLVSATAVIANPLDGAAESLAVTSAAPLTANYNSTTGVLSLSGPGSYAQYQSVLRSLVYNDTALNPDPTTRQIQVLVNDGQVPSPVAVCLMTIIPVHVPPVVDLNGPAPGIDFATTYAQASPPVAAVDATHLTVSANNSATLAGAAITLVNPADGAAEQISVTTAAPVTVTTSANGSQLLLSGVASLATYQGILRSLVYADTAAAPTAGVRTLSITVSDGILTSAVATSLINVQVANPPPTLDAIAALSVLENSGVTSVPLTGISDGGAASPLTLSISAVSNNHAVLLDPTVVYTGSGSTANLLLAPIANQSGTATITVTVQDNGGTALGSVDSISRSFTVTVIPVTQPPTLDPIPDLTIAEGAPPQTVPLTGISAGPPNQLGETIAVAVASSQPGLIPTPTLYYQSPQSAGIITFQPLPGQSGTATIIITVTNSGGTANGGVNYLVRSFRVAVIPALQPLTVVHDSGLSLDLGSIGVIGYPALTVSDGGPAAQVAFTVTQAPTAGVLQRAGVALSAGDTFTQADINAGLLAYQATGNSPGTDGFTFTAADGAGQTLPPTTFPITVLPAGSTASVPVITLPSPSATWVQGGPSVALDALATVSDANPALNQGVLTIAETAGGSGGDILTVVPSALSAVTVAGSTVSYQGTAIGTLIGGQGAAPMQTLAMTLTSAATPAAVQAVLRCVAFANDDAVPQPTSRTIQVTLADGSGGVSLPVQTVLHVTPVRLPPVITLPDGSASYTSGQAPVILAPNGTFTDVDVATLPGGTLIASWTANGSGQDQLGIASSGSGPGQVTIAGNAISYLGQIVGYASGGADGAALTIGLTAQATPGAAQAILRSLTFTNPSPTPSILYRQLSVVGTDGQGGASTPATMTVVVHAVDQPPVITLPSAGLIYNQGSPPLPLDPLATLTDVSQTSFPAGVLTASFVSGASSADQLVVGNQGQGSGQIGVSGTTVSYGGVAIGTIEAAGSAQNPLIIELNSAASLTATQALLRQICMLDTAMVPIPGPRQVQLTLSDGQGATSLPASTMVTVRVTDLPPVITLPSPPALWAEHAPAIAIDAAATLTDPDSATLAGGGLTISMADAQSGDVLTVAAGGSGATRVTLSGSTVLVGGTAIGTVSGGDGITPLTVAMNAQASLPAAQAVLRSISFSHLGEFTADQQRSLQVVASDGTVSSAAGTTITLHWLPDPPIAQSTTLFTVAGVAVQGALPGNDPQGRAMTWSLPSAPAHGSAQLIDAAGTVLYSPQPGFTGVDTFTYRVTDPLLASQTQTVSVVVSSLLGAPRPQVISTAPFEGILGQTLTYQVVVDTSQLPSGADLQYQLVGAPPGASVVKTGPQTATVTWTATGTPEAHQSLGILITDTVSQSTAYQALLVLFHGSAKGNG